MEYEKLNLLRHKAELLNSIGKYKEAMDYCNYALEKGAYEISEENRKMLLGIKALSYAHLGYIENAKELIEILPPDPKQLEEKGKLLYFPVLNN